MRVRAIIFESRQMCAAGKIQDDSVQKKTGSASTGAERLRAEVSREFYKSILEFIPDGFVIADAETKRLLASNRSMCEMLGYSQEEIKQLTVFDIHPPADAALIRKRFEDRRQGDRTVKSNMRVVRKDGSIFYADINARPITFGQRSCLLGIFRDVSKRRRNEELLDVLAGSAMELSGLEHEEDVYGFLCRSLKRLTGPGIVAVNRIYGDKLETLSLAGIEETKLRRAEKILRWKVVGSELGPVTQEAKDGLMSGKLEKVEGGLWELLFRKVPRSLCNEVCELAGIKDFYAMGMRHNDKLFGSITIIAVEGTKIDKHAIETLVNQASIVLERKQAVKALQKSKEKYRRIVENTNDALFAHDLEGNMLEVNENACRMMGYDKEELLKLNLADLAPKGFLQPMAELVKQLLQKGTLVFDGTTKRKDGSLVPVNVSSKLFFDKGQHVIQSFVRDITERKLAEEELRESEQFSKNLLESSPTATIVINPDTSVRYVNASLEELTGFSADEIVGIKAPYPWWTQDTFDKTQKDFVRALQVGAHRLEEVFRKKDGTRFRVEITSRAVKENSKLLYCVANWVDVTDRKIVEQIMRESEETIREIFVSSPDAITVTDLRGKIIECNQRTVEMHGFSSKKEVVGANAFDFIVEGDRHKAREGMKRAFRGEAERDIEYTCLSKDGRKFPVELSASVIRSASGKPSGFVAVTKDITERKRAAAKLSRYQSRLRRLASELTAVERKERRKLAEGLHDSVGQRLAMLKLQVQSLATAKKLSEEDIRNKLNTMKQSIEDIGNQTHSLTFELSNPVLYDVGLDAGIDHWLKKRIDEVERLEYELSIDKSPVRPAIEVREILFQAVRELVTNVIKHSGANKVFVDIEQTGDNIQIRVSDNGMGFDVSKILGTKEDEQESGFGLFNIKERIEYLGGRLNLESRRGQGTKAVISVPIKKETDC